jgi:hypothetical protein
MGLRTLLIVALAITAPTATSACGGPPDDCYPGPESDMCDGNVLVLGMTCGDAPDQWRQTGRVDCGAGTCQVDDATRVGMCESPCASNADCPQGQYCSDLDTPVGQGKRCLDPGPLAAACDIDNPQTCRLGLECLLIHPTGNPSLASASCVAICSADADCMAPLPTYCSSTVVTSFGEGTCQLAYAQGYCDPTSSTACEQNFVCKPNPSLSYDGGVDAAAEGLPPIYTCQ